MLKEFKEFAIKGNVIDLAVAVIIGAAFGAVVKSLVEDIIMPPVGFILGNVDFANLVITIKDGVVIKYGVFINTIVSFCIISFSVFVMIKQLKRLKKEEPLAINDPGPNPEILLLREIRDLLKLSSLRDMPKDPRNCSTNC